MWDGTGTAVELHAIVGQVRMNTNRKGAINNQNLLSILWCTQRFHVKRSAGYQCKEFRRSSREEPQVWMLSRVDSPPPHHCNYALKLKVGVRSFTRIVRVFVGSGPSSLG